MNGYTHMVVGGLSVGVIAAASISSHRFVFEINKHIIYPLIGIIPAIVGGLGPDIDMPNSKSEKWIRKILTAVIVGSGIILLGLVSMVLVNSRDIYVLLPLFIFFGDSCALLFFVRTATHRHETHSGLLFLFLMLPFVWLIFFTEADLITNFILSIWAGFCTGGFSHLIADTFNKKGVPWLLPISKKHYHFANIVTGSYQETMFRISSIIIFSIFYLLMLIIGGTC